MQKLLDFECEEAAQLRRALKLIFPPAYIEQHQNSGGLFSARLSRGQWEASSESSTRSQLLKLRQQFEQCLQSEAAKPVGLCPIRRSIYNQCFDELIRQVTVCCIERGLLLFRIKNELAMTINYYRRAYESAVAYAASKAVDFELKSANLGVQSEKMGISSNSSGILDERQKQLVDKEQSNTNNIEEYYQGELAKKDEIIAEQRAIIEALTRKSIDNLRI